MWISVSFLCYHKTFSTMRFFVDSDSDECAAEQHNCDDNASCSDIVGGEESFQCSSNSGYSGDGVNCTG